MCQCSVKGKKVRVPKALYADDSVCGEFLVSCSLGLIFLSQLLLTCLQANQMENWAEQIDCFLFACSTERVDSFLVGSQLFSW